MTPADAAQVSRGSNSRREFSAGQASILDVVEAQYERAALRNVRRVVLEFPPIPELVSSSGGIFSAVDREDHEQARIARLVWLAKTTVFQTLLPFDDARLALADYATEIRKAALSMPNIASGASSLANLLEQLLAHPKNPKREWFMGQMVRGAHDGLKITVLAGLQGARTPGWPPNLSVSEDFGTEGLFLVRTRKELRDKVFDRAVITGTTRFSARPVVADLLYGGRARDVFLLVYRNESAYIPEPLPIPSDRVFQKAVPRPSLLPAPTDSTADTELDTWVNRSIWEEVHSRHGDMVPISERDITVAARFVLFADESGTFLPDDRRVVEISGLLDSGGDSNFRDEQLPRKAVRDLEEGDLVLLRLAGGGHYVEDVANGLMAREGLNELRHQATEWKESLHRALKLHGEGYVAKAARKLGLRLRTASYLWAWAGDAVMAPQDLDTFTALIKALSQLDAVAHHPDPVEYAREKWQQMERVKAFHIRAGTIIRNALLERVREFVAARQQISSVASIELPGVSAGRMGLLRVSAVDNRTMQVPLSQLFHIRSARGK